MKFEWDENKSRSNEQKHGIDFALAREMWSDLSRVEILVPYPIENRSILIAEIGGKIWTSVFTRRGDAIRIISVRRARKREAMLYGQKENG